MKEVKQRKRNTIWYHWCVESKKGELWKPRVELCLLGTIVLVFCSQKWQDSSAALGWVRLWKSSLTQFQHEWLCVCVCVNFSTPTNSSLMPEACPRIQLNSNTIYWKVKLYSTSKGLIPHLHPLLQTPITSPGHYLYFWLTSCKSELPTTLSLRLMNLPELFRELRKIHYLLYYWFILKEY